MLDQVALPRPMLGGVREQAADGVALMEAGPDLLARLPARFLILGLHDLGVVLEDIGQVLAGQNLTP